MFLHRGKKIFLNATRAASVAFCLALCSCADDAFPEFTVENSFLADGKAAVVFSAPIEAASAKKDFLFARDDVQVDGEIFLSGNALLFFPNEKITDGHRYKIQVFSGARDQNGNTLQFDYCNTINARGDCEAPKILFIKEYDDAVEIQFSKDVSEKSFLEKFSIKPEKEFFAIWSEGSKKVRLAFKSALAESVLYSVKIESGLEDLWGNKTGSDFYWSWTKNPDAKAPECIVWGFKAGESQSKALDGVLEGADFDKGLELSFSKEIDSESLWTAVSVEPPLAFEIFPQLDEDGKFCKSALVKFSEKPKWGQEVLFIVGEKIADKSGAKIKEKRTALKNNAEDFRPPVLECVAVKNNGGFLALDKENSFSTISFPTTDYPDYEEKEISLYFLYSISRAAGRIDRLSAMEATSVQANSCAAITLKTMQALCEEELLALADFSQEEEASKTIAALKAQGKKLSLVACRADFRNCLRNGKPAHGLIEFTASQKICDDKKNFMEESALFSCNKN